MLMASAAWAHGAHIEYEITQAIQLTARYDNGDPMAEAQVTVYSPSDPANVWQKGVTDQAGQYIFAPDPDQSGNWEVQVRQAGHGDIVAIPMAEADSGQDLETLIPPTLASPARSENGTGLQKGLMVASVIWGCVGTALFFSRQKK
jgi:nickel transport protein